MIMVTAASLAEMAWIPRNLGLHCVKTQMGKKSERSVSKLLSAEAKPTLLLSTGFCGGLTADLGVGTVIIARAISYRGQEILIDSSFVGHARQALLAGGLPVKEGKIVTTENVIQLPEDKKKLADSGAIAVWRGAGRGS